MRGCITKCCPSACCRWRVAASAARRESNPCCAKYASHNADHRSYAPKSRIRIAVALVCYCRSSVCNGLFCRYCYFSSRETHFESVEHLPLLALLLEHLGACAHDAGDRAKLGLGRFILHLGKPRIELGSLSRAVCILQALECKLLLQFADGLHLAAVVFERGGHIAEGVNHDRSRARPRPAEVVNP